MKLRNDTGQHFHLMNSKHWHVLQSQALILQYRLLMLFRFCFFLFPRYHGIQRGRVGRCVAATGASSVHVGRRLHVRVNCNRCRHVFTPLAGCVRNHYWPVLQFFVALSTRYNDHRSRTSSSLRSCFSILSFHSRSPHILSLSKIRPVPSPLDCRLSILLVAMSHGLTYSSIIRNLLCFSTFCSRSLLRSLLSLIVLICHHKSYRSE